jgi:hypothetical protein
MLRIEVKGLKDVEHYLDAVQKRELPFALAKALTKTAQDVQAKVISGLPSRFTLRTKWFQPNTPFGFKIEKATKTNLVAKVYTRAPWMQLQETGGVKQAPGKRLAIPFLERPGTRPGVVFGVKRTKRDLIMKSQKPQALGSKAFILKGKKGDLLAMRTGRGKRSILRILYGLEPKANIKARLHFAETAQQVVDQGWRRNFEDAIAYALRTSRR